MLYKSLLNIVVLFFVMQTVVAQHPVSIQLTQKDGLPDIEFYDMIEDDSGFMWLACNNGLYRYDGREFKSYSHPEKRGIPVFGLKFDDQKRLWFTNITGQYFYIENDTVNLFLDISKELNEQQRLLSFVFFKNNLIVYGKNTLISKNLETKKVRYLEEEKPNSSYYNNAVVKNDTLFLNDTSSDIILIVSEKNNFKPLKYITYDKRDFLGGILYNYKDNVYLQSSVPTSQNAVTNAIIKGKKILNKTRVPLKEKKNINLITVLNNKCWFLTQKGVKVCSQKDREPPFILVQHYFPHNNVTEVIKDKQENYWFSTLYNGIYIVPNIHVNTYPIRKGIGNISTFEKIDNRYICFGTTLGWVGKYDIVNNTAQYTKLNTSSKVRNIVYNKKWSTIYVSADGISGSFILDVATLKVAFQSKIDKGIAGAKELVLLDSNQLLVARLSSITVFNISQSERFGKRKDISSKNKRNYTVCYDATKKDIYAAYIDELIVFNEKMQAKEITFNGKSVFPRKITQTDDGIVWVATVNSGLLAVKDYKVIKAYTTKDGLLSNFPNYIKADGNHLWIACKNGLQLLNHQNNTLKKLTQQDGIESFNITGIEVIGNIVWFSSNLGLFSFDKTKVFKPRNVINPYFTSVTIADSTYTVQKKYDVAYDENRIVVNFNTNQFKSALNTQYRYKLKGLHNNWRLLNRGVNELEFNNLYQGNYTFQLQTINYNRLSEIKEIQFNVEGVFYKQWWFLTLLLVSIISLIVFYYRSQLKKQEVKRNEEFEKQQNTIEKTALKLENLRSQMNPHFVFNALNSIQDYIIHNQKDLAGDYLGKFADLIRMYLDQSIKKEISLFEEINTLKRYLELEKLRFEDKLDYKVFVEESIDADTIFIPTMLLQPYIENSLKHGLLHKRGRGSLVVTCKLNDKKNILTCVIIDDGVGREKSKLIQQNRTIKYKSFATKATQDRLQLLNYNKERKMTVSVEDLVKMDNLEDCGTKVTIQIPI